MDYEAHAQAACRAKADVTIGCIEMPRANRALRHHAHRRQRPRQILLEKPADPPPMPGKPDMSLAQHGFYVFDTKFLFDELRATPTIRIRAMISART